MIDPARRAHLSAIGRIGGLTTAATHDNKARTAPARRAFRDSFDDGHGCSLCPHIAVTATHPVERAAQADRLYKLHFARMRLARETA